MVMVNAMFGAGSTANAMRELLTAAICVACIVNNAQRNDNAR